MTHNAIGLAASSHPPKPHPEYQYLSIMRELVEKGGRRMDRTGVGTTAVFGREMRFDLSDGFPVLTTKKVFTRQAFTEMLWMLSGGQNIRELLQQNVSIWSEWPHKKYCEQTGDRIDVKTFEARVLADDAFAEQWGSIGGTYGKQWRAWEAKDGRVIDQISDVIHTLKTNPTSRRIMWEGWNVGELSSMILPPCHKNYYWFVDVETNKLNCNLTQRSGDIFLGVPFNLVNLALVTHLMASVTGYDAGEVVWWGQDVHLYSNHVDQANLQLQREPRAMPRFEIINKRDCLFDYKLEDFRITDYDPHPHIAAPVAV